MLGIGTRARGGSIALVSIENGSVGIAVVHLGSTPALIALVREDLPLETRSDDALAKGILQALSTAGEKVSKELSAQKGAGRIGSLYAIVGAPWTRSVAGEAYSHLEVATAVTGSMISDFAKQSLEARKDIERKDLLEANVVRVLLNGYPTAAPEGKRADEIRIFTLLSDCRSEFKQQIEESLSRTFPDTKVVWRSSARATLQSAGIHDSEQNVIATVGSEATDLMVVRKGILSERMLIPLGMRQIAEKFAEGKPVEETLGLLEMLEKDQCETDACKALEQSIAKAEPELVKSFGEIFAKLSAFRKLPDRMTLIAPQRFSPWLSRFFTRIDFTQFTVSARPFSVSILSPMDLPQMDPRLAGDPVLSLAYTFVNMELHS